MKKLIFAVITTVFLLVAAIVVKSIVLDKVPQEKLNRDEIETVTFDLFTRAGEVYEKLIGGTLQAREQADLFDGIKYYKVVEDGVTTADELKTYVNSVFLDGSRLIDMAMAEGNFTPRIIEHVKRLYVIGKRPTLYTVTDIKSVRILSEKVGKEERSFRALVDFYYFTLETEIVDIGDGWRIKSVSEHVENISEKEAVFNLGSGILSFDDKELSKMDMLYSVDEIKSIFKPLLERGITVHERIKNSPSWSITKTEAFRNGNHSYYFADTPEITTLSDVWNMALSAYTESAAIRLFKSEIYPVYADDIPRYVDEDGKLYYHSAAHGRNIEYDFDTFEVVAQYKDVVMVSLLTSDGEEAVFVMQNTDSGWRLENSENERYVNSLGDQEIRSVVNAVLRRCESVLRKLVFCDFETSTTPTVINGREYYMIVENGFKTMDDVEKYFHSAFHYSFFDLQLLKPIVEGESAKYIEKDGRLYTLEKIDAPGELSSEIRSISTKRKRLDLLYLSVETDLEIFDVEINKNGEDWILHRATVTEKDSTAPVLAVKKRYPSEEITFDSYYLKRSDTLTRERVLEIFRPLLNRAYLLWDRVALAPPTVDGVVKSPFLKADEDIKAFAYSVFTTSAAERIFFPMIKGGDALYTEGEGNLYFNADASTRQVEYLFETLEIVEQYEGFVMVKLDRLVDGALEKNVVFSLHKTKAGWRLENGEYEKYDGIEFYDKFYLNGYSSATVFAQITLPEVTLDMMTYTPNERTAAEDFDFGSYVPFVSYDVERYSRHSNAYHLAFLNENTKSFDEGHALWERLNNKWRVTYPYTPLGELEENSLLAQFLFESKISYVSADGFTLGRIKYICEGEGDYGKESYLGADWRVEYDVIENGQITKTFNSDDYWDWGVMRDNTPKSIKVSENKYEYVPSLDKNGSGAYLFEVDENRLAFSYTENGVTTYRIYSLDSGYVLCEFKLPSTEEDNAYCTALVDDRWLVINRNVTLFAGDNGGHAYHNYQAVYIYDFNTGELSLAEDYAEEPRLSPDGRYLLYLAPWWDSSYSHLSGWDKAEIGIYIKNLENGETVFYPHESIEETTYHSGRVEFISWVERVAFEKLIK